MGINTGKGKRVQYTWRELFLLGLALEYIEIGSTPERIVQEIFKYEDVLLDSLARLTSPQNPEEERCFLITELSGLLALKSEKHWPEKIGLLTQAELIQVFSNDGDDRYRSPYAIIDLRQTIASILIAMFDTIQVPKNQLLDDLKLWSLNIQSVDGLGNFEL